MAENYTTLPNWHTLVEKICSGDPAAGPELERRFSSGLRLLLRHRAHPHALGDKVREICRLSIEAVRQGSLSDPDELPALVRMMAIQATGGEHRGGNSAKAAAARMERALRQLSARDRSLLLGFYRDGRSPEEICAEHSVSRDEFDRLRRRFRADWFEPAEASYLAASQPAPLRSLSASAVHGE